VEKKENGYHVLLSDGSVYKADALLMAAPRDAVQKMFSQHRGVEALGQIPTTSVANVALAFDARAVKQDLDGTGFVVSRKGNFRITACTWTHRKWPHAAPNGKVLLRGYVGSPDDPEAAFLSDDEITEIVLHDLQKVMKIDGKPEFRVVSRYQDAMPQYTVGHLNRLEKVEKYASEHLPGVSFAGASFRGVGVPDCISQGEEAAADI